MHFDLIRMRRSRTGKYDVLFKHLFSMQESSLRKLVGAPGAKSLPIEFSELFAKRADALLELDGNLLHVEFQTKNEADLPWRMLEYYVRIINTHANGQPQMPVNLKQLVLYIGTPRTELQDRFETQALRFRFSAKDIRSFSTSSSWLIDSHLPEDWVLGVLCMDEPHHDAWIAVARKVQALRGGEEMRGRAAAQLLIAATLREVPAEWMRKLEAMTAEINIENSPIFMSVFERGEIEQALACVRDIIELTGIGKEMRKDDADDISGFGLDQLEELRRHLLTTGNLRESVNMVRRSGEPQPKGR